MVIDHRVDQVTLLAQRTPDGVHIGTGWRATLKITIRKLTRTFVLSKRRERTDGRNQYFTIISMFALKYGQ